MEGSQKFFSPGTYTGSDRVVVDDAKWSDTIKLLIRRLPDPEELKVIGGQDELIGKKVHFSGNKSVVIVSQAKTGRLFQSND